MRHSPFVRRVHDTRGFDDAQWHALLGACPMGQSLRFAPLTATLHERLASQGFWRVARDTWQRIIDLHVREPVIGCDVPGLPGIGCVVVPSVARPMAPGVEHYIYGTLRSLLASMPTGTAINVMVGTSDASFVSKSALVRALGVARSEQVHVFAASAAIEQYLRRHAPLRARTTWNHARALASYTGSGKVLFVEDDVLWSRRASEFVMGASWMTSPSIISLYHAPPYNGFCFAHAFCQKETVLTIRADLYEGLFSCCQALLYEADFAREVACMLRLRMNGVPTDTNMANYFWHRKTTLGFARPSLVQHIGRQSSGLSAFHEAVCFVPEPALDPVDR